MAKPKPAIPYRAVTVRLPEDLYGLLQTICRVVPGSTPSSLIRDSMATMRPQLTALTEAVDALGANDSTTAIQMLLALTQSVKQEIGVAQDMVLDHALAVRADAPCQLPTTTEEVSVSIGQRSEELVAV